MKTDLFTIKNQSFILISFLILIGCKINKNQEISFEISEVRGEGYFFSSPDDKINLEKMNSKFSSKILEAELKKTGKNTFEIEMKNKSNDTISAINKPFGVRSVEDKTKVVLHFFPIVDNEHGMFEIEFADNALKITPNSIKRIKFNGYDIEKNVIGFSYQTNKKRGISKMAKEDWVLLRN